MDDYSRAFSAELRKEIIKAYKSKASILDFAKRNSIDCPTGINKFDTVLYITDQLTQKEVKRRFHGQGEQDFLPNTEAADADEKKKSGEQQKPNQPKEEEHPSPSQEENLHETKEKQKEEDNDRPPLFFEE
jgi:hypothetical protein